MGSNPTGAIMNTPALDQALTNQSIEIKDRVAELESLLAFYLGEGDSDTLHPVEAEYRKLASIEDNERTKEQTTELVRLARRMRYVSSRNIFDWADQVERLEKITDTTFDAGVYKGMEAAAKIKHPEPAGMRQGDPSWAAGWHRGVQDLRVSIRAEAKQLAGEADSRECSLSASGESRAPASPSPGSASPVDPTRAKHPARGDYVERATFRNTIAKQARVEGMQAAARLYKHVNVSCDHERQKSSFGVGAMLAIIEYRDLILATIKQQTGEADSRELAAPASPLLGSASPVLEMVRKLYDLAYHASRNAHQAWEHETSFEVCTTEVCINARETLEANANNAVHRDGGYSKE
ncbi:MAG: hypothetical protein QQN63_08000 [Nitrosopumilus sp.]